MKKLLPFLLFIPAFLAAQSDWKSLQITPAKPKPGEKITVRYAMLETALRQAEKPEFLVLEYNGENSVLREENLGQGIGNWTVEITTSPKTEVLILALKDGEKWDNNSGGGYVVNMYDDKGKILPQSKAAQAALLTERGDVFELKRDQNARLALFKEAFATNPKLRSKYLGAYVRTAMAVHQKRGEEGKAEMRALLDEAAEEPAASEKDLSTVASLYERIGAPEKSKSLKDKLLAKYPNGVQARQTRIQAASAEANLAKREELLDAIAKDFPPQNDEDKNLIGNQFSSLANQYAGQKNWDKFTSLVLKIQPSQRASLYNNMAWGLAENNEDLDRARSLSALATDWAKMEKAVPSGAKPAFMTRSDWEQNRAYTYAMYADSYAFILDKTGDPQTAAKYQAEVVEINHGGNAEFNERFTEYLERAGSPDLRYQLEGFIMKGAATAKMKEKFKQLYVAEDKSDAGATAYLATLEQVARTNMQEELTKKMLDESAPAFTLKNLNGETVSLESLRGKVVVVDFWATWCGPCKASFPGMQIAVNKYKADPNVAFVFVDTWENGDNKEKNAADFIKDKGYTFNVLMDNDNKVVSSFGVSGIPTKYVVDKYGKIRFKSVGYAGSSDALVDELSMMIDVAKGMP